MDLVLKNFSLRVEEVEGMHVLMLHDEDGSELTIAAVFNDVGWKVLKQVTNGEVPGVPSIVPVSADAIRHLPKAPRMDIPKGRP